MTAQAKNVWLKVEPEVALSSLPDKPDSELGYLYAFTLKSGTTKVGFGSNPKAKLKSAIADGNRRPESQVMACLFSVPHREYWKTEFAVHNRLAALRDFGDNFRVTLDEIAEILGSVELSVG